MFFAVKVVSVQLQASVYMFLSSLLLTESRYWEYFQLLNVSVYLPPVLGDMHTLPNEKVSGCDWIVGFQISRGAFFFISNYDIIA